jgi:hypothetical protein
VRLGGRPLAIQQDQDIIAVNYPARLAGVTKHMPVAQVHVFLGGGNSVCVQALVERVCWPRCGVWALTQVLQSRTVLCVRGVAGEGWGGGQEADAVYCHLL